MHSAAELLAALGQRASRRLRERPVLELANGLGLGLLLLAFRLWQLPDSARIAALAEAQLWLFLVAIPLGHLLFTMAVLSLLRARLAGQFRRLFDNSQLALWLVSGDFPPELSGIAARLAGGKASNRGFARRLDSAVRNWHLLSSAAASRSGLSSSAYLLVPGAAALWTSVLTVLGASAGLRGVVFAFLFVLLSWHFHALYNATARDHFALALQEALEQQG